MVLSLTEWPAGGGEMARRVRTHDWAATALGAVSGWDERLKAAVDLIMGCPLGMIALWGPDLVQVYNDGYAAIMGEKHPSGLGQATKVCWPEVWAFNAPIYETVKQGGSHVVHDQKLVIERRGSPEETWWDLTYSPLRDALGSVTGVLVTVTETTERLAGEAALQRSENQFRGFVTASSDAVYRMSPDWSEMRELKGGAFLADAPEPRSGWLQEYIHPDDQPAVHAAVTDAIAAKRVFELEHRVVRVDGTLGWTSSRAVPLLDPAGDIAEWVGTATDVTERRLAAEALRESEEQQRLTLELVPVLLWWIDAAGEKVALNERWRAYTGQSEAQAQGFGWLDAIHPDDLEATSLAFRHAFATGEPLERHYRIRKAGNGYRWHLVRHVPVRGETGAIMRWFGAAVDVNELHGLQERQRVLLFELQHRVRNTLAVVRALARSTAETSDTVEDFAAHFEGRLNALARTQTVLTRSPSSGVDLESMVREELLAQAPNMDPIDVGGPDVRLSAKAAEVLALAVHELATNAVKYGALASLGGSVAVRWEMATEEDETWLKLRWKESGVRVIARAPRREGFGTELVTQRVPYELRGRGSLDLRPGGMRAEIAFPMRPGESILQTNAPGV